MKNTEILDTTLRDGMQAEGISFSVNDKLNILKLLDSLCIDFAEVGTPASNVKDNELFERLPSLELKHVKPVAFSSTCIQYSARIGCCFERSSRVRLRICLCFRKGMAFTCGTYIMHDGGRKSSYNKRKYRVFTE